MEEIQQHQRPTASRLGLLKTGVGGGEIVEVQGGHIVRSTGRKDRHSKVCTAKGPRDRRVRLSAHTAIQFYDVQDRLGYDRPSKAVDWLINKAKSAIDELAQLPPWHPTATNTSNVASEQQGREDENQNQNQQHVGSSKRPMEIEQQDASSEYGFQQQHLRNNSSSSSAGFLPPSLDSDSIADTIKSFFPVAAATSSSPIHFQNYSPDPISRTGSHTQDLRLSLQSFQDPILLQHHHSDPAPSAQQSNLFLGSSPPHYDVASGSWSDQQHTDMGRLQRMIAWNPGTDHTSGGDGGGGGVSGGGFVFNSPPPQSFLSHSPFFSQRGPLQSSNSPQFRAWAEPSVAIANNNQMQTINQSGIGFASGEFSGFRVPARIQGEEEHDLALNKPPSASRH